MTRSAPVCLVSLLLALGCAPPNAAQPYPSAAPEVGAAAPAADAEPEPESAPAVEGIAKYFDREVDLAPFLAGFPYGRMRVDLEHGKLFYYELGERYTLKMLEIPKSGRWALETGATISEVDWSKRSLWGLHLHAPSNTLWLHADASNDEVMNLWTLSLDSGALEQITEHDYVYGYGFSEDDAQVAYLPRAGKKAPFSTCLRVREVASGKEREVVCDSPKLTFTWSDIRFTPDGDEVFFNAQVSGDRTKGQLVRVDLRKAKPKVELVTNAKVSRNSPSPLEGWLGNELLYTANDDGYSNLYAYDRVTKKTRQITRFTEDLSAERSGDKVLGVHKTPAGSTVVLVDPKTSKVLEQRKFSGSVSLADAHGDRAYLTQTSPDIYLEGYSMRRGGDVLGDMETVVSLDPALEEKLVACKASTVEIPTFDEDPETGKTRTLHAFLLEPRDPLPPEQQMAMITAFYGGRNGYSKFDNIMCAAGLTVLSPAVRGSSGFGKDFYSLNDKDLGGDEIVDVFYAARWLEERTGLSPRRIGVKGGSHGGYATMRALTFPPTTNGRNESYPLGFGMAHAGFSDIKTFYDATNIPDWVVLESGDPNVAKELATMKDRSPMQHVDLLRAPLLLTHGSQDWRVPVDESRQFAKAARELEKPVQYVEIEGQGHHIEGLALQVQVYQARFDFLAAVAKAAAAQ
ncbi:MAG: prolyl oligopeptidase family serine peptidase [Nannocystaceae bacterium]|nr:prolyl oligopeptidase family serine peptidase [bacterium]